MDPRIKEAPSSAPITHVDEETDQITQKIASEVQATGIEEALIKPPEVTPPSAPKIELVQQEPTPPSISSLPETPQAPSSKPSLIARIFSWLSGGVNKLDRLDRQWRTGKPLDDPSKNFLDPLMEKQQQKGLIDSSNNK